MNSNLHLLLHVPPIAPNASPLEMTTMLNCPLPLTFPLSFDTKIIFSFIKMHSYCCMEIYFIHFHYCMICYYEYNVICAFSYQWAYGLFQFFAMTSSVATSILLQASRYTYAKLPICSNKSARPQGIWMFNFIKEDKIALQSGWTNFIPKGRKKDILLTYMFSNTWYF